MTPKEIIKKVRARKKTLFKYPQHDDMVKYIERRFKVCDDIFEECNILVLARWINKVQTKQDSGVCAGCVGRNSNAEDNDGYWYCPFYNQDLTPQCPAIKFCSPMLVYDHLEDILSEDRRKKVPKDFLYPILLELCRELLDKEYKYEHVYLYSIYKEVF